MLDCKYIIWYLSYPKTYIQCKSHLLFHFCQYYKSKTQKVSKTKTIFECIYFILSVYLYVTCYYSHNIYMFLILWTVFVLFEMFHTQTCFASSGYHTTLSFTVNSFFSRSPLAQTHMCKTERFQCNTNIYSAKSKEGRIKEEEILLMIFL